MFTDVMVDIETTDTDPARGCVIQIAAVKFNRETREVSHEFFDRCLHPNTQPNRRWSDSTREWWSKMPTVYQGIMRRMEPTIDVLQGFQAWAGQGMTFWGKPTHFDFSFLQSLYADYGLQIPFHFRTANDLNSFARGRYFPEVPPQWEKIIEFTGDAHNALHDCLHQLKVLYKILDKEIPE